jgi:hypothetical protein
VLEGVCLHEGKRYYAFCVDENYKKNYQWWRRYLVVDLPPEVWKEEDERHAFFVEKVGDHFEFDIEKQCRKNTQLKPYNLHSEFYEKYPPGEQPSPADKFRKYPIVGWFEVS